MRVARFFHTISPCHSSSHCRLGKSGQGEPSFCADFPMPCSRSLLRMRRCLVAVAYEMPRRGFGSSCLQVLNSSRWSHIAMRSQTLSIVSSHKRVSGIWGRQSQTEWHWSDRSSATVWGSQAVQMPHHRGQSGHTHGRRPVARHAKLEQRSDVVVEIIGSLFRISLGQGVGLLMSCICGQRHLTSSTVTVAILFRCVVLRALRMSAGFPRNSKPRILPQTQRGY